MAAVAATSTIWARIHLSASNHSNCRMSNVNRPRVYSEDSRTNNLNVYNSGDARMLADRPTVSELCTYFQVYFEPVIRNQNVTPNQQLNSSHSKNKCLTLDYMVDVLSVSFDLCHE